MNCHEAQLAIKASVQGGAPLNAETVRHITACEHCQQSYDDLALEHALRGQRIPPPREGFVDEVIAIAIRDGAQKSSRRSTLAASIALIGLVIGVLYGYLREGAPDSARVSLAAHEGKTVRVLINSPSEQEAATVTIELAENLELAGFPNERRIEWQTDLAAGKNLLALPLTLTDEGDSHFNVALSYGSTRKNVRVSVQSAGPKPEFTPIKV